MLKLNIYALEYLIKYISISDLHEHYTLALLREASPFVSLVLALITSLWWFKLCVLAPLKVS